MHLRRHYKILELLSHENRWFLLKELAENLECSIKTIRRDLSLIKDFLPKNWSIQLSKNKGVRLNKPLYSSIRMIEIEYSKKSLLFQSLKIILYKNTITIEKLARTLYIQNTKMRSVLCDIESYLKQYELSLKKRPLRIEGNEINLILMYYELYLKSYNIKEWPFNEISQTMCNLILHKMEKTLHIKFFPESIHRLSFFIAIYFIRKNNRFNISTDNEIIERCTRSHTYKISKPLIINILKKYNIIPDEKDIIIILLAITNSLYRYEKQEIINKEYATHIITSKQFYNLISLLEETFSISLHDDEVFTFSIVCIVAPRLYNSKLFMHNRFLNITDIYIKNKHTKTFKTIKIILTDWIKSFNNEYYINDNDIINLTMQVEAIKMQQHHQKKIILLLNKGENWERYFKAYLNSHFNKQINYVDITYEQLTEEDLNCKEFACIITDVPLANSLKTIPLILISSIPTKRELEEIGKLI